MRMPDDGCRRGEGSSPRAACKQERHRPQPMRQRRSPKSAELRPEVDGLTASGLTSLPCSRIAPPRIGESCATAPCSRRSGAIVDAPSRDPSARKHGRRWHTAQRCPIPDRPARKDRLCRRAATRPSTPPLGRKHNEPAFRDAPAGELGPGFPGGRRRRGAKPIPPGPSGWSSVSPPAAPPTSSRAIVAQDMSAALGQPVVVENRTGANALIATEAVAREAPDGHTLLVSTLSHSVNAVLLPQARYDPLRDFAPVGLIALLPLIAVTGPDAPFDSVRALVAAAKARPREITYGSAGNGGSAHLAGRAARQPVGDGDDARALPRQRAGAERGHGRARLLHVLPDDRDRGPPLEGPAPRAGGLDAGAQPGLPRGAHHGRGRASPASSNYTQGLGLLAPAADARARSSGA